MEFDEFYLRYAPVVRRYAVRLFGPNDADDITQEVMARAMPRLPELCDGDPLPWLRTVAYRLGVDAVRRDGRVMPTGTDDLEAAATPVDDPAVASAMRTDRCRSLGRALRTLRESDRALLVARYLHGATDVALAHHLGISTGAVRQRTFRAVRRLRRAYQAIGGPHGLIGTAASATHARLRCLPSVPATVPAAALALTLPLHGAPQVPAGAPAKLVSHASTISTSPPVPTDTAAASTTDDPNPPDHGKRWIVSDYGGASLPGMADDATDNAADNDEGWARWTWRHARKIENATGDTAADHYRPSETDDVPGVVERALDVGNR